jgi:Cu/Ag efflux protein CusF
MIHEIRRCAPTLALATASLLLAACGGGTSEAPAPAETATAEAAAAPGADVYEVRGEVTQLPNPDNPSAQLMVQHEPIPDFKNSKGEMVGMNAMEMPFPVGEGVSLDGIAVGDKVILTFEVQFQPSTRYEVTAIEKLPADTTLDFGDDHDHDHDHSHDHDHDHTH